MSDLFFDFLRKKRITRFSTFPLSDFPNFDPIHRQIAKHWAIFKLVFHIDQFHPVDRELRYSAGFHSLLLVQRLFKGRKSNPGSAIQLSQLLTPHSGKPNRAPSLVREQTLARHGDQLSTLIERVNSFERNVAALHVDFASLSSRTDSLDARLERVERRLELH